MTTNSVPLLDKYESFYLPPQLEKTFICYKAIDRSISALSQASLPDTVVLSTLQKTLGGIGRDVTKIYSRNNLKKSPQFDLMARATKEVYQELFLGFKAQKERLDKVLSQNTFKECKSVQTLMANMLASLTQSVEPPKKIVANGWLSKASGLVSGVKTAIVATYEFSKTVAGDLTTTIKRHPKAFAASFVLFMAKSLYRSMYPDPSLLLSIMTAALSPEKLLEYNEAKDMFLYGGASICAFLACFNCAWAKAEKKAVEKTTQNLTEEQLEFVLPLIKRVLKAEGREELVIKLITHAALIGAHARPELVEINGSLCPIFSIGMSREFGRKGEGSLLHELGHVFNGEVGIAKSITSKCAHTIAALLLNQNILPTYLLNTLFPPTLSVDTKPSILEKILPLCYLYHYVKYDPSLAGVIVWFISNYFVYSSLQFHYAREYESRADDFAVKHASMKALEYEAKEYEKMHFQDIIPVTSESSDLAFIYTVLSLLPPLFTGWITASGDVEGHFLVDIFKHGYDLSHLGNDTHPSNISRAEKYAKAKESKSKSI
jgi:hypothetical protein